MSSSTEILAETSAVAKVADLRSGAEVRSAGTARIAELDIIRGVALLGVIMVNLRSGSLSGAPAADHGTWNQTWAWLIEALWHGKAYPMFATLFGIGLAIQLGAEANPGAVRQRRVARRLGCLAVLGCLHGVLVWDGDILATYAVCGAGILLLEGFQTRTLLALSMAALAIWVVGQPLWRARDQLGGSPGNNVPAAAKVETDYARMSYGELVMERSRDAVELVASPSRWVAVAGRKLDVIGVMLLGFALARGALRRDWTPTMAGFRRVAWLLVGLSAVVFLTTMGAKLEIAAVWRWPDWAARVGRFLAGTTAGVVARRSLCLFLAVIYGVGIAVVARRWPSAGVTRWLGSVGRFSLTMYLGTGLIATTLFYGYGAGWFGTMGSFVTTLIAAAIYGVQGTLAWLWHRRWTHGPVEWVWRWCGGGVSVRNHP